MHLCKVFNFGFWVYSCFEKMDLVYSFLLSFADTVLPQFSSVYFLQPINIYSSSESDPHYCDFLLLLMFL